uniref:Putative transcription-associated protein 1 n=1 Tax=Anopheles darlingi TaxID=43151 RepID=A0A2M4DP85_ANODA
MFTLQLALSCLLEYALCLTRLNPDMIYLHQDSGLMNVSYFRFEMDDSTGLLDVNRPVPFRLTPNIAEFISSVGVAGPLTASAVATARCFIQPSFKLTTILKAILKDEIIAFHKKRLIDEKVLDQSQPAGAGAGAGASATPATTATGGSTTGTAAPGASTTTTQQPTDQDAGTNDIDNRKRSSRRSTRLSATSGPNETTHPASIAGNRNKGARSNKWPLTRTTYA